VNGGARSRIGKLKKEENTIVDLFEKCRGFYSDPAVAHAMGYPASPHEAQEMGFYPFFIPLDQSEGTEAMVDGRRLIMIGSNNYLGLTSHPYLLV
jgi:hypothetical protein